MPLPTSGAISLADLEYYLQNVTPGLIEAVKELDAKQSVIDSLEERISRLEALLNK